MRFHYNRKSIPTGAFVCVCRHTLPVNGGQCTCSQLRLNDAVFAFFVPALVLQTSALHCCQVLSFPSFCALRHSFEELASGLSLRRMYVMEENAYVR